MGFLYAIYNWKKQALLTKTVGIGLEKKIFKLKSEDEQKRAVNYLLHHKLVELDQNWRSIFKRNNSYGNRDN